MWRCRFSFILLMVFIFVFFCFNEAFAEELKEDEYILITADKIFYSRSLNVIKAEGDVILTYTDLLLKADVLLLDLSSDVIRGSGSPIVFVRDGKRYSASKIEFSVRTKTGILLGLKGKEANIYFNVKKAEFKKASDLPLKLRKKLEVKKKDEIVEIVEEGSFTTCNLLPPHYELVAKKVYLYPSKKVILKSPRLYVRGRLILTLPWDVYILLQKKKGFSPVRLKFKYDSDFGFLPGIGEEFLFDFGKGGVNLYYIFAEGDFEGDVFFKTTVSDVDFNFKFFRNYYTSGYGKWGYTSLISYKLNQNSVLEIKATKNEYVKRWPEASCLVEGTISKKPQITFIHSDDVGNYGSVIFGADWGIFSQEVLKDDVRRTGLLLGIVSRPYSFGGFSLTWALRGIYKHYYDYIKTGDYRWIDLSAKLSLPLDKKNGSIFSLVYAKRWDEGLSVLPIDEVTDRNEIYTMFTTDLSKNTRFKFRWSYDFNTKSFDELFMVLNFDLHCWALDLGMLFDDNSENEFYLNFYIKDIKGIGILTEQESLRVKFDPFPFYPYGPKVF